MNEWRDALDKPLPAQDGDDGEVGDEAGYADDELQDDLQPEVDHRVRLLHVLKKSRGVECVLFSLLARSLRFST